MKYLLFFPGLLLITSCATNRAPSLNILEKRADYDGSRRLEDSVSNLDNPFFVPNRTEPKVADIWIHPHEMPTGDYFRGGWIRTIVNDSRWQIKRDKKESK